MYNIQEHERGQNSHINAEKLSELETFSRWLERIRNFNSRWNSDQAGHEQRSGDVGSHG